MRTVLYLILGFTLGELINRQHFTAAVCLGAGIALMVSIDAALYIRRERKERFDRELAARTSHLMYP